MKKDILFLFLILKKEFVSLDEIVKLSIFEPSELWKILEEGVSLNKIIKKTLNSKVFFTFNTKNQNVETILSKFKDEIWYIIFTKTTLVNHFYQNSDSFISKTLFHKYVDFKLNTSNSFDKDVFFIKALMETNLWHSNTWLSVDIYMKAVEIAISLGDLKSQAVFYSTIAVNLLSNGKEKEAQQYIDKAEETIFSLGNPGITVHVMRDISFAMIMNGKIEEAINYYENIMETTFSVFYSKKELVPEYDFLQRILNFNEAEDGLMGYVYFLAGQLPRGLEILYNMIERGKKNNNIVTVEAANIFLGMIFASRGEIKKAESFVKNKLNFWKKREDISSFTWALCIVLASIEMHKNNPEKVKEFLILGHKYRTLSNFPHHYGPILMEVLEWYETKNFPPIKELNFESEIERLMKWPDIYMKAVALRFVARKKIRNLKIQKNYKEIFSILNDAEKYAKNSGAIPELQEIVKQKIKLASSKRDYPLINRLEKFYSSLQLSISSELFLENQNDFYIKSIENLIEEITSLKLIKKTNSTPWKILINRICNILGAEKYAFIEVKKDKKLLIIQATKSKKWIDFLINLINSEHFKFKSEFFNDRIFKIYFKTQFLEKQFLFFIENKNFKPSFDSKLMKLFKKLSSLLGIVAENFFLWKELNETKQKMESENNYFMNLSQITNNSSNTIVGKSKEINKVHLLIKKVAPLDSTVLIFGETGTGKELVAREIHNKSNRKNKPFIVSNIASISKELVASTMFGHEKGAFTGAVSQMKGLFEMANNGTIFLDEIGELSLENQVRLLRILQEGTFVRLGSVKPIKSNFRLIVATNKNLEEEVAKGNFRKDLFFRLNVFPIEIPPLRKRKEDIMLLAAFFMKEFSKEMGKNFERINSKHIEWLENYNWPGNVRELKHIIERASILSEPPVLKIPQLSEKIEEYDLEDLSLDTLMKKHIEKVLKKTKGKIYGKNGAAEILGLKPPTLYLKINQLGLKDFLQKIK